MLVLPDITHHWEVSRAPVPSPSPRNKNCLTVLRLASGILRFRLRRGAWNLEERLHPTPPTGMTEFWPSLFCASLPGHHFDADVSNPANSLQSSTMHVGEAATAQFGLSLPFNNSTCVSSRLIKHGSLQSPNAFANVVEQPEFKPQANSALVCKRECARFLLFHWSGELRPRSVIG